MAAHRVARDSIVNNVFNANNLTDIDFTARELVEVTVTNILCIEWLAQYGLIKNVRQCDACNICMNLQEQTGELALIKIFGTAYCYQNNFNFPTYRT